MSDASKIEWTDATWNPVRGCSIVSRGCTNCYAMRQAHRFAGAGKPYAGLTKLTKGGPVWTGKVRLAPGVLDHPLRWRTPRRIFVNSMSDLFHEDVPDEFIYEVFSVMARARHHTYQVLTKRPGRMLGLIGANEARYRVYAAGQHVPLCGLASPPPWPLPHVWLGVSVEDQAAADERIPLLLQTPAAVRWISAEPLLGPVDLIGTFPHCLEGHPFPSSCRDETHKRTGLDWVVAGGESGPGARPMHPDWARSLRDQCAAAGVPFFFKQWGEWTSIKQQDAIRYLTGDRLYNGYTFEQDGQWRSVSVYRLGKKAAGRLLDGRTHDEDADDRIPF